MEKPNAHVRRMYAGAKSALLTVCLGLAMTGCQKAPDNPLPPQAPPTPKAQSSAADAGNVHPGLYDASNVSSAVFKYKFSDRLQFQNAQGKRLKHLVIRT